MKNKQFYSIFIIGILLLSFCMVFIQPVKSEDELHPFDYWYAPSNSFGIQEIKSINWSCFKSILSDFNVTWHTYYKRYSYSDWSNGDSYTSIHKTWNETGFWKINLTFVVPVDIYEARFYFNVDLEIMDYIEVSDSCVFFNYTQYGWDGNYNLMFNYSDLKSIPNLYFAKGVSNNKFWFYFGRSGGIPKNSYSFDPVFGNTAGGGPTYTVSNVILGSSFQMGSVGGVADNVSAYLQFSDASFVYDIKFCIYNNATKALVGTTDEYTDYDPVSSWTSYWVTCSFSGTKPTLVADTYYLICAFADNPTYRTCEMVCEVSTGDFIYSDSSTYPTVTNPFNVDASTSSRLAVIYCSYTEAGGEWENTCPSATFSPVNASTGQNLDIDMNITTDDDDGNNTFANWTCTSGDSGNWSNQGNGTQLCSLKTLNCDTTYYFYVNISDDYCTVFYYVYFTTESCPYENNCPSSSGLIIDNSSTDVNISVGWWNFTITDADGNNTYGNFTCLYSNNDSWSNEGNGTKSLQLYVMPYNTLVYVFVNYSDIYGCDVFEWFSFTTEEEYVPPAIGGNITWNITILKYNVWFVFNIYNNTSPFTVSVECSNGYDDSFELVNGTFGILLENLSINVTYIVYVNISGGNSSNFTINESSFYLGGIESYDILYNGLSIDDTQFIFILLITIWLFMLSMYEKREGKNTSYYGILQFFVAIPLWVFFLGNAILSNLSLGGIAFNVSVATAIFFVSIMVFILAWYKK